LRVSFFPGEYQVLEILVAEFVQNGRRDGPEFFSELHLLVDQFLDPHLVAILGS